jgi:serine-type D-Ala-D-Ala carboxypeptidase/endopeptidase
MAPTTRTIASAFIALCSFCASEGGAEEAPETNATEDGAWIIPSNHDVRALLERRMQGMGMVVGIIEPAGRRVVAFGRMNASDSSRPNGDTVFQIGSVTKVFTGLLLADMVQRGEVGIDDPASMYLPPGVTMPQRGRPITLIDLAKHLSGLPSMPTNFSLLAEPNPYAAYTAEQLYTFLSGYTLPREPGTQHYSNVGVALLGRLLARHAGMDYEAALRERILQPLNLKDTSITLSADQARRLAPGHDRFLERVETWELRAMPASGSLRSTANDLLEFLAYNLGYKKSKLDAAMLYQRTPMRALGWGRTTLGGDSVYGHDGGKEGYRAGAVFNPRTRTGVVVLTNSRNGDRPLDLAKHLLFSRSPLPATTRSVRPKTAEVSAATLDAYAGEYQVEPDKTCVIARKDDELLLDIRGEGVQRLLPSSAREFFSRDEDLIIEFDADGKKAPTGFTLHAGNGQQHATRIGARP